MSGTGRRVAVISPLFHPELGGLGRQAFQLTNALARAGERFVVVSRRLEGLSPVRSEPGIEVIEVETPHADRRFLETVSWRNLSISLAFARGARRAMAEVRPEVDLVHVHGASLPLLWLAPTLRAWDLPTLSKVAAVGIGSEVGSLSGRFLGLGRILARRARTVDAWVATSGEIWRGLLADGMAPDRIVRIPNGVDSDRFRPPSTQERREARDALGVDPNSTLVVAVGRMVRRKGFDDLIDAWARIASLRQTAELHLCGDGPERAGLERRAEALAPGHAVRFPGYLDRPELALRAADLFVLPSRFEGFSNALLEAIACGLPAVVTTVSGTSDLAGAGIELRRVEIGRPAALATALAEGIEDAEWRRRAGSEGATIVRQRFSLESTVETYRNLYAKLRRVR